jgi:Protein of unknown function (DUF3618)
MIMASQSEQLEREAEETRWQLSGTLEELRSWTTPGRVVDQLLDYTRNGAAGDFFRNLGREVRENPMPVVLIGIGIVWLALASSRTSRAAIANAAESVARTATDLGTATSAAVARTSEWGQQTATRLSDRASNVASIVSNRTAELGARASEVTDGLANRARAASEAAGAAFGKAKRPLTGAPEKTQSWEQPVTSEPGKALSAEDATAVETAHESR